MNPYAKGWCFPVVGLVAAAAIVTYHSAFGQQQRSTQAAPSAPASAAQNADRLLSEGKEIFRYDTFGSEEFWGGKVKLHEAIAGDKNGGVGPGVTARQALELGLKVDVGALPKILVEVIKGGSVDLDKVDTTLELLRANAVVGLTGFFDKKTKRMTSIGIQCALCHFTVDDSLMQGIGSRLDGYTSDLVRASV